PDVIVYTRDGALIIRGFDVRHEGREQCEGRRWRQGAGGSVGGRVCVGEPSHDPLTRVGRAHGMENQLARPQLVVTHQRPIVESQSCGGGCVCGGGLGWGQTTISPRSWSVPIFLAEVV